MQPFQFSQLLRQWLPTADRPRRSPRRRARRRLGAEGLERRNLLSVNVVAQQLSAVENTPLTISQSQLLAGDADGNVALRAGSPTQPGHATLVANPDGTFTFTPDATFVGGTSFSYTVSAAVAQTELTSADGADGDLFGGSVSISGDTAVVGAPYLTVNGHADQGAAYVFVRSGTAWVEQQELTAADGAANDRFGSSVAVGPDGVVVGAPGHAVNGQLGEGAAYVFVPGFGGLAMPFWVQQAELTSAFGAAGDAFGASVAASGDTVVVGKPGYSVGLSSEGAADVFVRSGTSWAEQQQLIAPDAAANDEFGFSVAVSGDTVVVGAPNHAANGHVDEGAGYVFVRSAGAWSQQVELTSADGAADDGFGNSVALSGDTAVIGARFHTVNGKPEQGAAYVFAYTKLTVLGSPSWNQQAELTSADGAASDHFGASVAIGADRIVVGAPKHNVNSQIVPGEAYVFVGAPSAIFGETSWNQQAEGSAVTAAAADAQFGASVAISGDTVIFGAPSLIFNGAAYIQELGTATATATVNVAPLTPPTSTADTFVLGGGSANSGSGLASALANDTSSDGKPQDLVAVLLTSTTHGSLTLRTDGSFTYMPDATFQGIDRFSYQATEAAIGGNTATVTLLSYNASLVDKLYHQVLHRSAEDAGLTYWTSQLDGGASLDAVAKGIFNSVERLDPLVTQFYVKYLMRATDPGGLAHWVADWQTTGDPRDVVENILASPEFFNDAGDTDNGFVTLLYQRVLVRVPDMNGLAFWTGQLDSGQLTRPQVAAGFYDSPEQHVDLVDFLYGEYFNGATPTSAQADPYIADLDAGQTETQVELAIVDSPDYRDTPPAPAAGTVGLALYQH